MGGKTKSIRVQAMPRREREVGGPGSEVIESKLGLGKEIGPAIGGEGDVTRRHDGNKMVFGGTHCSLRREEAMVVGRDILKGDVGRIEEGGEIRGGLVIEKKVRERRVTE